MANPRAHLTSSFWQYVENLRQLRQVCKESASHVLHGRHKKIVTKLLACKPHFESSRKSMQGACRVHALQSTHSSPRIPVHALESTHSNPHTRVSAPEVAQPSCCRFKHQSRDALFEFEPPHPAENAVSARSVPLVLRHGPPQNQGSLDTLRAPSGVA